MNEIKTELIWLNKHNGADLKEHEYASKVLRFFRNQEVTAVIMGSAYGGSVEHIARMFKDTGNVYGFDTFEGHPVHLAVDKDNREATCMDHWYREDIIGKDKLDYDYQRGILNGHGLYNAHLIKGEVNKDSLKVFKLNNIHYAMLDMDILTSMEAGYEAVKNNIVKGGYLLLHDVATESNLPLLNDWFWNTVIKEDWDMWKVLEVRPENELAILQKK